MNRSLVRIFLVALSAALLVLPFHFGELWFLASIAFIPYLVSLKNLSSSEVGKQSYLFGCLFYAGLGYWLGFVNWIGLIFSVLYLGVYFLTFGLLLVPVFYRMNDFEEMNFGDNLKRIFVAASAWVVIEYVRGYMLSGVPWALLGYSQWKNSHFIQIAEWTGAYGVSFFVIFVNLVLYRLLHAFFYKGKKDAQTAAYVTHRRKLLSGFTAVLLIAVLGVGGYGILALRSRDAFYASRQEKAKLRVSVVQGNIPQELKWDSKIKGIIFEKYRRLTFMSAVERSDLIVWPETSFPGYLEDEPVMSAQLRSLVRQSKTDVIVGAPTVGSLEEGLRFYNSAILFGPEGEEKARYSKVHLVPFGEYIPFEGLFGFLRRFYAIGHFSPGKDKTIFQIQSRYQERNIRARFGVLICYEDIFPGLVRGFVNGGADFLINMTNDAWFGKTTAPYQHAQASLFRAIENRVPVVRAANTGLSCFISPEGRILDSVKEDGEEIFVTGRKGCDIVLRKTRTFYTRFGDVFVGLCFAFCVLTLRQRNKQNSYARL